MQLTSANVKDIRKYYCESFVKFKDTGDFLWFLRECDEYRLYGVGENGDEVELHLDDKHPYELDYVLPRKSYFQFDNRALLLYRIPAQQYSRGLTKGNTNIVTPSQVSGNVTKTSNIPISFETLKCYVNKQRFAGLEEALRLPYVSVALSPRMALYASEHILLDLTVIGKVVGTNVKVVQPLFEDELQQLVNNTPFKLTK